MSASEDGPDDRTTTETPGRGPTDQPNVLLVVLDTTRAATALSGGKSPVMPNFEAIATEGALFETAITNGPWTLPAHASLFTGQYTADHGAHAGTTYFDPEYPPLAARLRAADYRTAAVSANTWVSPTYGFGAGFETFWSPDEPIVPSHPASPSPLPSRSEREGNGRVGKLERVGRFGAGLRSSAIERIAGPINEFYERHGGERDTGARLTNRRIEYWLRRCWSGDQPFFLFANYLEPHLHYDAPEPFKYQYLPEDIDPQEADAASQDAWGYVTGRIDVTDREFEALRALYKGELRYLDFRLGELYRTLASMGVLDSTLVILAGDHGENVGEHGLMDHQYSLYDTVLRVPLCIRYPESVPAGRVVSSPVEIRDVFPTVLDAAGLPIGPSGANAETTSDRSLLNALDRVGRSRDRADPAGSNSTRDTDSVAEFSPYAIAEYLVPRPFVETLREHAGSATVDLAAFDRGLRCLRTDRWKYVERTDGTEALFDLASDPDETCDRAKDRPDLVAELRAVLRAERGAFDIDIHQRPSPEDRNRQTTTERTDRRLQALGYI